MKLNKIGIILGFLIIGGMFTFVMSIDAEIMCSPPKVSNTVTDVGISDVVVVDGYEVCRWIVYNDYRDEKIISIVDNVI